MEPPVRRPLLLLAALYHLLSHGSISTTGAFSSPHHPSSCTLSSIRSRHRHCSSRAALAIPSTTLRSTAAEGAYTSPSSSSSSQAAAASGVSKTTVVEGTGRAIRPGDAIVVKYSCSTVSGNDDNGDIMLLPFARSDRQRMIALDGTMIRGWDMALRTMKEGERATISITDPAYAYGVEGVPPFVPSDSRISIDLEIMNIDEDVMGGGGGSMRMQQSSSGNADIAGLEGMLDGPIDRPRTPAAIAAAYDRRMKDKAMAGLPEEREGIDGFIDWIRGSYFFGLFEGETGQVAPWYLTPSITFPIAFAVVGLAFWVSLAGGAISERGMPTTDELDEIIVSFVTLNDIVRV